MFGVLSDLIVTANRRHDQQLNRIEERLETIETTDGEEKPDGPARQTSQESAETRADLTQE
jgi:hypothetical protein